MIKHSSQFMLKKLRLREQLTLDQNYQQVPFLTPRLLQGDSGGKEKDLLFLSF